MLKKINYNKYTDKIKQVGNKSTFSVVGYVLGIVLLLYFFKVILDGFRKLTGQVPTDSELAQKAQSENDVKVIKNKYSNIYKKTSKNKDYFDALANNIQADFDTFKTDWKKQWYYIKDLTDLDLIALYISFGSRENSEYLNLIGDLPQWIQKEDDNSPFDFFKGKYVDRIKSKWACVKQYIPSASAWTYDPNLYEKV